MVRISKIDEKDKIIIKLLEENARRPYTEIAEKLGITEAAIRKRIKKLEEFGIIRRYTIEVNNKILGRNVAWIGVDLNPEKLVNAIDKIKKLDFRRIYISVGDHDIMLEFIYEKEEELKQIISSLKKIEGVTRICPAVLVDIIA